MKLKVTDEGYAEVQDGKPVYVDDNGKEITYDPIAMHKKIGELNTENQQRREKAQELEDHIKQFEDLDPKEARKALDTVQNLNDKKLVDAGEVEKVKQQAIESAQNQWQQKYEDLKAKYEKTENNYKSEKISGAFANSKFVKEKLAVPPDMAQATFGTHFEFKDGRITPKDANGNTIYSDSNPGDVATFDEALEKVVNNYPYKDSILKGTGNRGSGMDGVDPEGGGRVITREYFESLKPGKQAEMAKAMNEGKVKLQG